MAYPPMSQVAFIIGSAAEVLSWNCTEKEEFLLSKGFQVRASKDSHS